jgi:hypothetical protein
MRHAHAPALTALLVLCLVVSVGADRIVMRNGKVIEGQFTGATSDAVRVLLPDGTLTQVAVADVSAVEFTPRRAAAPPAPAGAPPAAPAPVRPAAPDPVAAPAPVVVPAGTMISVRLTQAVDVDASRAGMTFKARVDDPVMLDGRVVIPREATATLQAAAVQQSGTMKGSDRIVLKMNNVGFGGRVYEVATTQVETKGSGEGKKTARKIGGGVGLGALVGGIAGGGEGAAIGAAIGGATGTAVAAGGEEHLKIPAETRLQFNLTAAVRVQP